MLFQKLISVNMKCMIYIFFFFTVMTLHLTEGGRFLAPHMVFHHGWTLSRLGCSPWGLELWFPNKHHYHHQPKFNFTGITPIYEWTLINIKLSIQQNKNIQSLKNIKGHYVMYIKMRLGARAIVQQVNCLPCIKQIQVRSWESSITEHEQGLNIAGYSPILSLQR